MANVKLNIKTNASEASSEMRGLSGSIKNATSNMGGLTTALGTAAKGVTAIGVAVAGLTAGLAGLAVNAAKNQRELKNLGRLAGMGAQEFEKLAFGAERYDISAEKLGDISKDVTEKLGEFAAAGSGAFVDFMDVMKLTEGQTKALAKQFSEMPAPLALLEITRMMENEGVSRSQMSFVLESLGSDLTMLLPLLENNGKEWDKLSKEFENTAGKFRLSERMRGNLADLGASFTTLSATGSKALDFFVAEFGPSITSVFNNITSAITSDGFKDGIRSATKSIADFGILTLTVLSPVAMVVEKIADGLNKIVTYGGAAGKAIKDVLGPAAYFMPHISPMALTSDSTGNQSVSKTLGEGATREAAIKGAGSTVDQTSEQLIKTLEALRSTIDQSQMNNAKQSITVNKGLQVARGGL